MAMLEQLATVDEGFLRLRLHRTNAFVAPNAKLIRRLQADGRADPTLDPELSAMAISAMVSRTAYVAFAVGGKPVDLDHLVATLTRLWTHALGLTTPRRTERGSDAT